MKIAISGLSNSGKTTVFNALTGLNAETAPYASVGGVPNVGVVKVPDQRVDKLTDIYKPKKTTLSTVEYVDYIGLSKGDTKQNKAVFEHIKDADAIVHVVRVFIDDSVMHPLGGVAPKRDVDAFNTELLLLDMELVEKRLASMEQQAKRGKKPNEAEKKTLLKCMESLEGESFLRDAGLNSDELESIRHLQMTTLKPVITVLNISEQDINKPETEALMQSMREGANTGLAQIALCGKVEMDIAGMAAEDARAFLDDLGIDEPASNRLIKSTYDAVGLISFLTCGQDEVRSWAILKGTDALNAAGKIHSDIQRGFIRAEVVSYDDFISSGSMNDAKEKALLRLEGKTYIVRDGDIINFRFNV